MKIALISASLIALLLTLLAPLLALGGMIELDLMRHLLLAATVIWLAVTPFWMGKQKEDTNEENQS
jgi:hypothetical protein